MPVERISKGFKDISGSFQINPLNEDLIALKNETAIARSLRNLVLTERGERPFAPNLGCGVNALLFENMDQITASVVRDEIINVIDSFEPRVDLIDVIVVSDFDNNTLLITIQYYVVGAEIPAQELTFALQPTR